MSFYTLEGIDGSGKSTVAQELQKSRKNVFLTQEPTLSRYGELIRQNIAHSESDSMKNFFLFMADRMYHIDDIIRPMDVLGHTVISDRYFDSSRAYQSVEMSQDEYFDSAEAARTFIDQTVKPCEYEPDKTFYLDISVETSIERIAGDEKYEHRSFLSDVKEQYDIIANEFDRVVVIDAERSIDDIVNDIHGHMHGF